MSSGSSCSCASVRVYALGLILYELVAGVPPFVGPDSEAIAKERMSRAAPDLQLVAHAPDRLASVVARLLATRPEQRPAAGELEEILHHMGHDLEKERDKLDDLTEIGPWIARPTSRLVVETVPDARAPTLAILPLTSDAADLQPLAANITTALRETLMMTRGLRVSPAVQPTTPLPVDETSREAGLSLGVDSVVSGRLVHGSSPDSLRIDVHVLDVESGKQLSDQHLEGKIGSLMRLQQVAAQRIAEALLLDLTTQAWAHDVPDDALSTYLRARARVHQACPATTAWTTTTSRRC